MIEQICCPKCKSNSCEQSTNIIKKKFASLYPENAKKVICWLCYSCGASGLRTSK